MSMIGKTFAHYQIAGKIGKGGMGEVYQAKDQKLDREVAIKILPEEFAKDTDRIARFQREAKLLASLNHPNIASIYGLESSNEKTFIVLELIEGETLADRIKSGPIPVKEALKLALQIAEALEAAHAKGVIHRDLKPTNIKFTREGRLKILDFGLAKALVENQGKPFTSKSPTLSAVATQKGLILGTAAYMSPEQARGKSADKRSDIWSFGVILLEMLTGQSVFEGEDISQTLARVLEREPDFLMLPPNLHPEIIEILRRCLEKNAGNRYHDIADLRIDIQKVLSDPRGMFVQPVFAGDSGIKYRKIVPWLVAAVLFGAILSWVVTRILNPVGLPLTQYITRFYFELTNGNEFIDYNAPFLTVSADGSQIAYSTNHGIYIRPIGEFSPRFISGTAERTQKPFFSPDGKWIGYWSLDDNQLKKISVTGGAAYPLCNDPSFAYYYWNKDGRIIYAGAKGIMYVSEEGGTPKTLIQAENEVFFTPRFLPDGKTLIFTVDTDKGFYVAVQSLDSGERTLLFPGSDAQYFDTGHLVYMTEYDLHAVAFDLDGYKIIGDDVPIVTGIFRNGAPVYSISDSGTLVYFSETPENAYCNLVWVDREGNEEKLDVPAGMYYSPRISHDGTRIALIKASGHGNQDIYTLDVATDVLTPLTPDENAVDFSPLWNPDDQWIVFGRNKGASIGVYRKSSRGTGTIEELYSYSGRQVFPISWSKGGKQLLAVIQQPGISIPDIGMLSMDGDSQFQLLLRGDHVETQARISPDGEWIAFTSNESGQSEVYVHSFPDTERARKQISINGGHSPLWASNGREIFYRSGDSVMIVPVETTPELGIGKPEVLFRGTYDLEPIKRAQWDIHPVSKKFLMVQPVQTTNIRSAEEISLPRINVVTNWFEELNDRVPVP